MNYCPVCKREYRQLNRNQTGLCPVCKSRLLVLSGEDMERVRKEKKDRSF